MIYIPDLSFINDNTLINHDYTVAVNGEYCTVRACRVSAMPFNRPWSGRQRPEEQSEIAAFVQFYADEEVEIKINYKKGLKDPVLRPLSKGVKLNIENDTVTFKLYENGFYSFEPENEHFALHIFFNSPKQAPERENATYYFGPGIHNPLLLNLKDNDSVYIHPEAIVYTAVYAENAENVRIFGGGVLDNSCQERVSRGCYGKFPLGNIRMHNTSNIKIEDVILLDSSNWVLSLFNCDNVIIDGVKLVGQWRYNTDGIDITNTSNVSIKNCFVRSFDDGIVIKAIHDHDICENISVENCVLWCDWGKTLELGLETAAKEYRNISFKNCDLIHNSSGAMAISCGNHAQIHDISYENINVEYQSYNRPQVIQETDNSKYQWDGTPYMDDLIRLSNWRMASNPMYLKTFVSNEIKYGHIYDISYKSINVFADYDIGKIKISIYSETEEAPMENISISDVYLNGKPVCSLEEFSLNLNHARNITYQKSK